MTSIIITGAAGFIGSNLVNYFLSNTNMHIIAIDNLVLGKKENLPLDNDRIIFKKIDLADDSKNEDLKLFINSFDVDSVWHFAANSDIPAGVNDSKIDFRNTFLSTYNLLDILENKVINQIHFASSSAVYGDHGKKKITELTAPLLPISNYGSFKLASEAILSSFVEERDTRLFLYRFPNVVGLPATHGVIFDFINRLFEQPNLLEVKGDGTQRKQYLHVCDLISAMIIASKKLKLQRNILNIGPSDQGISVKEIAELTVKAYGKKSQIKFGSSPKGWKGDIPRFNYDISKLKSLNWLPKYPSSEAAIIEAIKNILFLKIKSN